MPKTKKPVDPVKFHLRLRRLKHDFRDGSAMMQIPAIAEAECRLVVCAYHGGQAKAAVAMLRESFWLWRQSARIGATLAITDRVGWTKLWHIPETNQWREHWRRHGRNCTCINREFPAPDTNCGGDCISSSIPRWFRWLTRFDKI